MKKTTKLIRFGANVNKDYPERKFSGLISGTARSAKEFRAMVLRRYRNAQVTEVHKIEQ